VDEQPNRQSGVGALWRTSPGTGEGGATSADWPAKVADTVEDVVNGVHDRVIRPLMLIARGLVFGIIVGAMALVLSVLGAVALVRVLDVYAFGGRVWASDALVGGVLTLAGAVAWSFRRPRRAGGS
jgi:hypothetical protein